MRVVNSRKAFEKKLIEEIQKAMNKAFRKFIGQQDLETKQFPSPALPRKK